MDNVIYVADDLQPASTSYGPENELAFRWFNRSTLRHRTFIKGVGMLSHNQDPGNGNPWQADDITKHCNGGRPGDFSSSYLSISTSPSRILRFMTKFRSPTSMPDAEVAVIDMQRLRSMPVYFKKTTELAQELDIRYIGPDEGRTKYVTPSHYLVHQRIPACCLLGFFKAKDFEDLCHSKDIGRDDSHIDRMLHRQDIEQEWRLESEFAIGINGHPPVSCPNDPPIPLSPPMTPSASRIYSQETPTKRRRNESQSPSRRLAQHRRSATVELTPIRDRILNINLTATISVDNLDSSLQVSFPPVTIYMPPTPASSHRHTGRGRTSTIPRDQIQYKRSPSSSPTPTPSHNRNGNRSPLKREE